MSDRILNDQIYALFCKSVIDRRYCSLHDQHCRHRDSELGMSDNDSTSESIRDFFNKQGGYQERKGGTDYVEQHNESYHFSQSKEETYIQELECITSNLRRLLSMARQRSVKVKAPQRPRHGHNHEQYFQPECYRPSCTETQQMPGVTSDYSKHNAGLLLSQLEGLVKSSRVTINNVGPLLHMTESTDDGKRTLPDENSGKDFSTDKPNKSNVGSFEDNKRKKKDTHNQSERKRRVFINNRITELRNLLPEHVDRVSCKKKGSILKESIEYIKQLRQDHDRIQHLHRKMAETENEMRRLTCKLKLLESKISTLTESSVTRAVIPEQPENITESMQYKGSCGIESQPIFHQPEFEVLTAEQGRQELSRIWDDLSTTITSYSTISDPKCHEMANEAAMENYLLT